MKNKVILNEFSNSLPQTSQVWPVGNLDKSVCPAAMDLLYTCSPLLNHNRTSSIITIRILVDYIIGHTFSCFFTNHHPRTEHDLHCFVQFIFTPSSAWRSGRYVVLYILSNWFLYWLCAVGLCNIVNYDLPSLELSDWPLLYYMPTPMQMKFFPVTVTVA